MDLFADQEAEQRLANHRQSWRYCWGWDGPTEGGYCEVNICGAEMESGGRIYCYMEQCRLIEQRADGRWLAVIEMGEVHGKPWPKDGTRLLLSEMDIWPPTKLLRNTPNAQAHLPPDKGGQVQRNVRL